MPSFGSSILPADRWDLVNYLRSIALVAPAGTLPSSPDIPASASSPGTAETKREPQGVAAKGRQVFEANCQLCHSADSEEVIVGPGLQGLFHWPSHALSDGTEHKEHTVEIIRRQIVDGGGSMAPVGATLSNQEMVDLIAYLQTL